MVKEKLTKKGQKKVKMAAFMVAVYAQTQSDKANAAGMATLRDTALKLLAAADAGKTDEAKKLAGLIKADIPADPAAKTAPVALEKLLELESVMRVFSSPQVGGFGLEKTLEDLADAKEPDAAQLEQAALVGQKAAFIAHLAQSYPPEKEEGKKTKAAWAGFATDMKGAALDLAATAAKKSPDVGKLANKLTTACTKCHDVFR